MSDASAPARITEFFIGDDEANAADFTTAQWHEAVGTAAREEYRTLRTRVLRFALIPLVFLALHFLLASFNLPVVMVAASMAFVLVPLFYFRDLMKDVTGANTVDGMIERFDLYTYTSDDKLRLLPVETFKEVLAKHFTAKGLKKKQRGTAVEKFLSVNTGKRKFLMWAAVIAHVIALVVPSGPFYGLAFATTYAFAVVATARYFRPATRQIRVLSGFLPKDTAPADDTTTGGNTSEEDTDENTGLTEAELLRLVALYHSPISLLNQYEKDMLEGLYPDGVPTPEELSIAKKSKKDKSHKKDNTTDEMHGPSDEDLLQMVIAYNTDKTSMDVGERQFLEMLFGNAVPTPKKFKAMLAETPDPKPESNTAPADDDTASVREPLPRRTPRHRRDDAPQSGPTGTPPHGIPAVPSNAVLSAPVPNPAPAPAASTYTPEELDALFLKYLDLGRDALTDEEFAAIEPYTKKR